MRRHLMRQRRRSIQMSSALEGEAQLDWLLSQRLAGRPVSAPEPLAPLLAAADILTPLRRASPPVAFARRLQADMLRRAQRLAADVSLTTGEAEPAGRDQPALQSVARRT